MKRAAPAGDPDAYVAGLGGWRHDCVAELRETVRAAAPLEEVIKWGHLVYIARGPVLLIRAEAERVLPSGVSMHITAVIPQLRTTNLADSIRFYTTLLGGTLEFRFEDFYAGVRLGEQVVHLKLVDERDPCIAFVRDGEHFDLYLKTDDVAAAVAELERNGVRLTRAVHDTAWGTREFVIEDDQGHTLYFGQANR